MIENITSSLLVLQQNHVATVLATDTDTNGIVAPVLRLPLQMLLLLLRLLLTFVRSSSSLSYRIHNRIHWIHRRMRNGTRLLASSHKWLRSDTDYFHTGQGLRGMCKDVAIDTKVLTIQRGQFAGRVFVTIHTISYSVMAESLHK